MIIGSAGVVTNRSAPPIPLTTRTPHAQYRNPFHPAWTERYRDCVVSAHVKDIASPGQNEDQDGWANVGAGVLEWRDLWQAARAAGARCMVVEHDKPVDPAETTRASYTFFSRMGI